MAQASEVILECEDNFQKQTNRNRMYICSPNGLQMLNIPVLHAKEAHQKTRDIRIENSFDWQKQHFKSLEAAYRSSPFFEYFEDDLTPIFQKKHTFLFDLNIETMDFVAKSLRLILPVEKSVTYEKTVGNILDYRFLSDGKKDKNAFETYPQVFENKVPFISSLSVLDLIFNEGRYALDYLKRQKITLSNVV